jgi:hypothetical protein
VNFPAGNKTKLVEGKNMITLGKHQPSFAREAASASVKLIDHGVLLMAV